MHPASPMQSACHSAPPHLLIVLFFGALAAFWGPPEAMAQKDLHACPHGKSAFDRSCEICFKPRAMISNECARAKAALRAAANESYTKSIGGSSLQDINKMDCNTAILRAAAWTDFKYDSDLEREARQRQFDAEQRQQNAIYARQRAEKKARDQAALAQSQQFLTDFQAQQQAERAARQQAIESKMRVLEDLQARNQAFWDQHNARMARIPELPSPYAEPSYTPYVPSPPMRQPDPGPSAAELAERARQAEHARRQAAIVQQKQQEDNRFRDEARRLLEVFPSTSEQIAAATTGMPDLGRFDTAPGTSPGLSAGSPSGQSASSQAMAAAFGGLARFDPPAPARAAGDLTRFDHAPAPAGPPAPASSSPARYAAFEPPLRHDGEVRRYIAPMPVNDSSPRPTMIFTPGLQSTPSIHNTFGQKLAWDTGADVTVIHNKMAASLPADVKIAAHDSGRIPSLDRQPVNRSIDAMAGELYHELKSTHRPVHVLVHSEGEVVAANALNALRARMVADGLTGPAAADALSRVRVVSLGGAWSGDPGAFRGVGAFARVYHEKDAVALGARGMGNLHPGTNVGDAHSLESTYYPFVQREGARLFEHSGDVVIQTDGTVRW